MKSPAVLLLTLLSFCAFAQSGIIKGRVIEAKSFKPLPFATVYLNQTTIGSVTNTEGDFEIKNIPAGIYDIVVSYVGYQQYQSQVTVNDSIPVTMSIKMSVATTNLKEVLVKGKKDSQWNRQFDKFQKQFFGISPYSNECKITNPWVLEFTEDDKGRLNAKAALPIEIENLGLGYNITCQLKDFVVGPNVYKISGTYRFVEAQTLDTALISLWHNRRQEVYLGSPRHLFKSIVQNRVVEEGFDLYSDISNNIEITRNSSFLTNVNVSLKAIPPSELVAQEIRPGQYTVKLPRRTEVHYLNRSAPAKIYRNILHPISWLEVAGGSIDITTEGVVINANRMVALGAMSEARVAELLPIDFKPNQSNKKSIQANSSSQTPYSKLAALLEKPYLMTDKSYYYPSDAVLFKAFFNYISPAYRDSFSHVMHVDLIDSSNKIVQTKMFPLVSGSGYGDFALGTNIQPGDYTLRAYTRWMLNFDKKVIFQKPIKVLPLNQLGKIKDIEPVVKQVQIRTEKDAFETREKITLAIEPVNFYGDPVVADLAISVTDIEQSAIPVNEKTIVTGYLFTKDMLPDSSLKSPRYFIQHGFDFKGQMVSGKKNKASGGVLTVYQDNVDDVFAVTTDETGHFYQQLQVMDSVELLVGAKTLTGRSGKVIMEASAEPVPTVESIAPLQLETYVPADPSKYHVVDLFSTAKMLEAVTIEAKKVEKAAADKKQLMSDTHIEGDFLRATNATDLLSALRGRVPGLKVLYSKDPATGDLRKFIGFGLSATFDGSMQECLVEIDGVALTSVAGMSVADQLATMSVNDVENVDVSRFASASSYGVRSANGVIVIKTRMGYKSEPGKKKVDRSKLQVVSMVGYSIAKEFESPNYSDHANGDDRTDYRSTIYWNPLLVSDGTEPVMVSFYAADIPTRYRIVVEGVTADGQAIRGEKIIVVTGKK